MTYEESLKQLEQIVSKMESGKNLQVNRNMSIFARKS